MTKVEKYIQKAKEAQKVYNNFTQEQVDRVFKNAAKRANAARIPLAKEAVEETGMGIIEDKVIKNHFASEFIYNKYKEMKTVGVFEEDYGEGYMKIYEPVGVVGAIIPTTNPTSTAIFKALIALKTRNAIIISPHPRAKNCTAHAAQIIEDAAVEAGAPAGLIQTIVDAKLDDTKELMEKADTILATGGGGMVKAAYSSGTPAIGVGAGNCPAIINDDANLEEAVAAIIQSNMFDYGTVCATENSVIATAGVYDRVIELFREQGAFVVSKKADVDKISKKLFREGTHLLNAELVGQSPQALGKLWKIKVPDYAKIVVVETKSTSPDNPLAHEKLSSYVSIFKAKDFDDAIVKQGELLELGLGHTSSLFTRDHNMEAINKFRSTTKSYRALVNMPSSLGAIGDVYNFHLEPSMTLGCGTLGGNSVSENIGPKHLLNIKTVVSRRENMLWLRVPSKTYFKFGSITPAFKDLVDMGVKKAYIVSDNIIFTLFGEKITSLLEDLGIQYRTFLDVEPNPSLNTTKKGAKKFEDFEPDAIIAFGGGSALDAAKLMWLFYEYPNVNFDDLAMRFMDIRKRIVKYPKLGKKAKLICIPTTSGTGAEVTPFAVITDTDEHVKYPLADYELTPDIAVVDAQFMISMPPRVTAATGIDALSHCFEAFVSVCATEFTDPYCLKGIELVFKWLPIAYKDPKNVKAREMMGHAAAIAGIAFANAFLGIIHSLSHKVGGHHGVIHGEANSIFLPYVIKYNSEKGLREKHTYFSQYRLMNAGERYAQIGRHLGLKGKTDEEIVEKLIKKVQELSRLVGIPAKIQGYRGVDEKKFFDTLDQMSEEAFDDQCTGANPRYPSIEDMKQIYTDAYYGNLVKGFKKK